MNTVSRIPDVGWEEVHDDTRDVGYAHAGEGDHYAGQREDSLVRAHEVHGHGAHPRHHHAEDWGNRVSYLVGGSDALLPLARNFQ